MATGLLADIHAQIRLTGFGFNIDADQRVWMHVFGPGGRDPALTRQVLNTALASLGRPAPGS